MPPYSSIDRDLGFKSTCRQSDWPLAVARSTLSHHFVLRLA